MKPYFRYFDRFLFIYILTFLGIALAEQKGDPCNNALTQIEMNLCAKQQSEKADKDINRRYRLIMQKLGEKEKALLKTAQRAWIAYRDANCKADFSLYEGGSIAPLIQFSCLEKMTTERIAELNRIYRDFIRKR